MAFKIASAYVAVTPEDDGFEIGLRKIVDEASANVDAKVGIGLHNDAPGALREDLDAALALVTEHLTADVGLGLKNDAVEELDADVKAGVDLVQDNNKIKVKVDTQAAQSAFGGLSPLIVGAFAGAATAGPGLVLAATAAAVLGAGVLITKGNDGLKTSYEQLGQDASSAITQATAPLLPAITDSLQILDQGIGRTGRELQDIFAAVAPDAQEMTRGLLSLVDNALPGVTTALKAIQPYSHEIADDFGKLGTGVSDFFAGLAGGAQGGATGLDALITTTEHLLGDVGQIVGALSNGLGPALHDISDVAIPVADALTAVIGAFPPGDIRIAADATAALFAAFELGKITGIVAEGMTFVEFLGAATTTEGAMTLATGAATAATSALGAAMDAALGPVGAIALAFTAAEQSADLFGGNHGGGLAGVVGKQQAAAGAAKEHSDALTAAAVAQDSFTTALKAASGAAGDNAQKTATATLAALGLTDGTSNLTTSLYNALLAYDADNQAASALKASYDALFGKYATYSEAQAQFTLDLANVAKEVTHGKDATNLSTQAGAKNLELFKQLADQNETRAEALLRETGSQDKANSSLQQGALALDAAAKKAGFTKDQIDQLNLSLYGTKNLSNLKITVGADTSSAVSAVRSMVEYFDHQAAYIQVYASPNGLPGGKALGANADGGNVQAGDYSLVGERGPEIVQFGRAGTVIPTEAIRKVSGGESTATGHLPGIQSLTISIPITGIVDLTDPNSMSTAARRMVTNIVNAISQLERSNAGARYR